MHWKWCSENKLHIVIDIETEIWTRGFTLNSFAPGLSIVAMQVSIPWLWITAPAPLIRYALKTTMKHDYSDRNNLKQQKIINRRGHAQTFMNRGAQSEHFGGLLGHGFDTGAESTFPSADITYMSSAIILSFCTPKGCKNRYCHWNKPYQLFFSIISSYMTAEYIE
jgi:hypothetical protein